MGIESGSKLNKLLQYWQPGGLLFSSWLKSNGYSDQLMQRYRKFGWFSLLSKGVMVRTGDNPVSWGALACYNTQMNKRFYIGAHTALELVGFTHYVPMGKLLLMVGHPKLDKVPVWMKTVDFEYEWDFFSTNTFSKPQLATIRKDGYDILASIPEQAFLECLLLAPTRYAYIDLFYIMEQLTTLRADIVQQLLETTDNIKIKRLFLYMAQKAGHEWFDRLDKNKLELGSGKQQLAENGIYVPEYKITIPKELHDYE